MLRIFIADDNVAARGILKSTLEEHEAWQVCGTAEDGNEAVRKAVVLKPDVIVLDLAMPGMDGLAAGREIKGHLPTVPILIYTLYDGHLVAAEAKKAGITQVVSKSDSADSLIRAIEGVMEKTGTAAAAAKSAAGSANANLNSAACRNTTTSSAPDVANTPMAAGPNEAPSADEIREPSEESSDSLS